MYKKSRAEQQPAAYIQVEIVGKTAGYNVRLQQQWWRLLYNGIACTAVSQSSNTAAVTEWERWNGWYVCWRSSTFSYLFGSDWLSERRTPNGGNSAFSLEHLLVHQICTCVHSSLFLHFPFIPFMQVYDALHNIQIPIYTKFTTRHTIQTYCTFFSVCPLYKRIYLRFGECPSIDRLALLFWFLYCFLCYILNGLLFL